MLAGLDVEDDFTPPIENEEKEEEVEPPVALGPQNFESLLEAELTLWDSEPVMPRIIQNQEETKSFTNPLHWWRANETRFPRLAKLAKRYLAIQATSAPAERLFSVAGLTIANDRARLLPDNAAMLIFLHENLENARAWRRARDLSDIA